MYSIDPFRFVSSRPVRSSMAIENEIDIRLKWLSQLTSTLLNCILTPAYTNAEICDLLMAAIIHAGVSQKYKNLNNCHFMHSRTVSFN